ncbi:macrolide ABC transporter permease [Virgibacillus dokdonensis]|uniref:Macrolide ABC transporter permease n=1 Tax=Virgibacillus dokdonensis TaxID=302167 RepID=A0A3E0WK20_9BACI|nr:ABC transporter permease [Virgibacillus dokdonensis]RFA33128.1 macrolide ABC transporter permease [Virgibacillus dokdonensis]
MNLLEDLRMAIHSIFTNKLRSLLTMLGIIIGVASVIMVVAVGKGGEEMLKAAVAGEGNSATIMYTPTEEELLSNQNDWNAPSISIEDMKELEEIEEIEHIVASNSEYSPVRYITTHTDATITGITDSYTSVHEFELVEGTSLQSNEFITAQRVAVISSSLSEKLFETELAIGQIITIGNQPVEVVGVLNTPTNFFESDPMEVFIPLSTWRNFYGTEGFAQISIQATSQENLQFAGEKAVNFLNAKYGLENGYNLLNFKEISELTGRITGIMTLIISGVAGISLFVGGIGVMNIMLVSVTERTKEIGIRMSLGATRKRILMQFLIEAAIMTMISGMIGITLGSGLATLISAIAGWDSLLSLPIIIGALLFSTLIGVVFGLIPANKAANLNPIEALRYE